MKTKTHLNALFALLAFALGGCQALAQAPASATSAKDEPGISLVSWNIQWYPGERRFAQEEEMWAHAERVKPVLAEINPDIFLAQEMRDWQSFAELTDAVPGLRPAVVSMFVSPQDGSYWRQQVAIASKLYTKAAWAEEWKAGEDIHPRRGFTAALIRVPNTFRFLLVYSVHLKSNLSRSEEERQMNYDTRDESIRQLLEHIRHMEETVFKDRIAGVVVGGDFNTNNDGRFDDNVIDLMTAGGFFHTWQGVPEEERLTWRGSDRFQPTTFDHFFIKGLGELRAEMLEVPDDSSDHWPVRIFIPYSLLRE